MVVVLTRRTFWGEGLELDLELGLGLKANENRYHIIRWGSRAILHTTYIPPYLHKIAQGSFVFWVPSNPPPASYMSGNFVLSSRTNYNELLFCSNGTNVKFLNEHYIYAWFSHN